MEKYKNYCFVTIATFSDYLCHTSIILFSVFFPTDVWRCHVWCNLGFLRRVTGGELFEDIVAREFYSEADAR